MVHVWQVSIALSSAPLTGTAAASLCSSRLPGEKVFPPGPALSGCAHLAGDSLEAPCATDVCDSQHTWNSDTFYGIIRCFGQRGAETLSS